MTLSASQGPRPPIHEPRPPVTLWRAMWNVTLHKVQSHPRWPYLTLRQQSELMRRQLCANCQTFISTPAFWLQMRLLKEEERQDAEAIQTAVLGLVYLECGKVT